MNKIPHVSILGIVLVTLWLLLSGHFNPLLLTLGLLSVCLVIFISLRMEVVDHEGHPVHLSFISLIGYWFWLMKAIVIANIDVIRRILSPEMPISPTVIRLKSTLESRFLYVIYANSITLTPGTVSMSVDDNNIDVHALTKEGAAGLEKGEMNNRLCSLEGHQ